MPFGKKLSVFAEVLGYGLLLFIVTFSILAAFPKVLQGVQQLLVQGSIVGLLVVAVWFLPGYFFLWRDGERDGMRRKCVMSIAALMALLAITKPTVLFTSSPFGMWFLPVLTLVGMGYRKWLMRVNPDRECASTRVHAVIGVLVSLIVFVGVFVAV